jgi:nicotinamidase-related amidase
MNIDPESTAFLFIDLQERILSRQLASHTVADVLSRSDRRAEKFRTAGALVVRIRVV